MRRLFNCGAIAHPGSLQDRKQMCAAQYDRPIIDDSRRVAADGVRCPEFVRNVSSMTLTNVFSRQTQTILL